LCTGLLVAVCIQYYKVQSDRTVLEYCASIEASTILNRQTCSLTVQYF